MDWDKLKIFHAVAEAGSFTSATVTLNLSQSAISRQIQSLEDDLKVKLFGLEYMYQPILALLIINDLFEWVLKEKTTDNKR